MSVREKVATDFDFTSLLTHDIKNERNDELPCASENAEEMKTEDVKEDLVNCAQNLCRASALSHSQSEDQKSVRDTFNHISGFSNVTAIKHEILQEDYESQDSLSRVDIKKEIKQEDVDEDTMVSEINQNLTRLSGNTIFNTGLTFNMEDLLDRLFSGSQTVLQSGNTASEIPSTSIDEEEMFSKHHYNEEIKTFSPLLNGISEMRQNAGTIIHPAAKIIDKQNCPNNEMEASNMFSCNDFERGLEGNQEIHTLCRHKQRCWEEEGSRNHQIFETVSCAENESFVYRMETKRDFDLSGNETVTGSTLNGESLLGTEVRGFRHTFNEELVKVIDGFPVTNAKLTAPGADGSYDSEQDCEVTKDAVDRNSQITQDNTQLTETMTFAQSEISARPIVCEICGLKCSDKRGWVSHKRIHAPEKIFTCDLCNNSSSAYYMFACHLKRHLGIKSEKKYSCRICFKEFTTNSSKKRHMSIHFDIRAFHCGFCNKAFRHRGGLFIHERIHTGIRPYKCTYNNCGKAFMRKNALDEHLKTHTGARHYQCNICFRTYASWNALKYHKFKHLGEKYRCTICGYCFSRKCDHTYHMKRHTLGRQFDCKICGKKFHRKNERNSHVKKMHEEGESLKKEYKCEVCDTKFKSKQRLSYHQHHSYLCDKALFNRVKLQGKSHEKLKKSEKEKEKSQKTKPIHKCKICGVKFSYAYCLNIHRRMHT